MIRNIPNGLFKYSSKTNCFEKLFQRTLFASSVNLKSFEPAKCYRYSPEEGYVRTSPYINVTSPNLTLDQFVWKDYQKWSDKTALVCAISGRKYTYSQLRDCCAALAVRLQTKFKLHQGDVIAICTPNIPEFAIVALAALEAGLIVTTINPIYTPDEIAKQLSRSNAKIVFGTIPGYSNIQNAIKITKKSMKSISIKCNPSETIPSESIDFFELIKTNDVNFNDLRKYNIKSTDLAFLPYSSGTTGLPKGVMLSHDNIIINSLQVGVPLPDTPLVRPTTNDNQDVIPCILPFFHIYGFTITLLSKLAQGTKIVTLPAFQPDTFLRTLVEFKGTLLHLVPPMVLFLADHKVVQSKHLASIETVLTGAAPIGALDVERFNKKAERNIDFIQGYGLTESSPCALMTCRRNILFASAGSPVPNTEAKIVNIDDGKFIGLGPNEKGELLVRGPQIMSGYLDNVEATNDTLTTDNWLRTGDLGHYDDNGMFYITDRLKELIKVKGFQVAPAELEEILRDHPKIVDAAVIGVPHEQWGEVPKAFVVKKSNTDEISENEIKEYVAKKVASFKQLHGGITFLETIPKNSTGKLMRRQLKETYCK